MFRALILLLAVVTLLSFVPTANAGMISEHGIVVPDLFVTLRDGLRAKNDYEVKYCQTVTNMVTMGAIKYPIVKGTFGWARRKPADRRFQYFKFALEKRLGYQIPVESD